MKKEVEEASSSSESRNEGRTQSYWPTSRSHFGLYFILSLISHKKTTVFRVQLHAKTAKRLSRVESRTAALVLLFKLTSLIIITKKSSHEVQAKAKSFSWTKKKRRLSNGKCLLKKQLSVLQRRYPCTHFHSKIVMLTLMSRKWRCWSSMSSFKTFFGRYHALRNWKRGKWQHSQYLRMRDFLGFLLECWAPDADKSSGPSSSVEELEDSLARFRIGSDKSRAPSSIIISEDE